VKNPQIDESTIDANPLHVETPLTHEEIYTMSEFLKKIMKEVIVEKSLDQSEFNEQREILANMPDEIIAEFCRNCKPGSENYRTLVGKPGFAAAFSERLLVKQAARI